MISNDPIFLAIRQLIDLGWLTDVTTAKYKGERIVPEGEDNVDPVSKITWAADGFSDQRSAVNGRMCKQVEDFRATLLKGNEQQQKAGRDMPQWFCRIEDLNTDTPAKAVFQVRENVGAIFVQRVWGGFGPRNVEPMREYGPAFYVKGTTEPEWRYGIPSWELDRVPRGPKTLGFIANHRACTGGPWDADDLFEWAQYFATPVSTWTPPK